MPETAGALDFYLPRWGECALVLASFFVLIGLDLVIVGLFLLHLCVHELDDAAFLNSLI